MSDTRYRRVRELFLLAYELPATERQALLDAQCDDDALRQEVESLLDLHDSAHETTLEGPQASIRTTPPAPNPTTQRFRPGELFADRYRIVSLLGEGGMGQVYRAEDETLGVTVAIKVLPDRGRGREPLLAEVRLAREITHPAICRVHDVGEWDGEAFITMEYVAGEDLAALLRRIGRLPPDKVLDIARQLGAGLAAAHAHGVLHRDLKPGNVLIDPEGRVRIADFGIAVGKDHQGTEALAGTPGYWAPELLIPGQKADEPSDLYSLGVVLYELATGHLPFDRAQPQGATPVAPSARVPGLDPRLEQAILRCLDADASRRPASALELVASLPGSDALSLAAEVDVTPSPEIVAAAGDDTALSTRTLAVLVLFLLGLLPLAAWLGEQATFLPQAGPLKAPEVLLERAREVAEAAGFDPALEGRRLGFLDDPGAESFAGSALFWVRQPIDRQVPEVTRRYLFERPDGQDRTPRGWLRILLDPEGNLRYLEADAPSVDPMETRSIDWAGLLDRAGIDSARTPTNPVGVLPVPAEERLAWIVRPSDGEAQRVEAATAGGRVVYFARQAASPAASEIAADRQALGGRDAGVQFLLVLIALAAIPVALLNLRKQRGDRRGAIRLALVVLGLFLTGWWLTSSFPRHPMESVGDLLASRLNTLVQRCLWLVIGYLALEPLVRQVWPQTLIAWSRALEGRTRDVLVGQSLVIGALAGILFSILDFTDFVAPALLGFDGPTAPLIGRRLYTALSPRVTLATALTNVPTAVYEGLLMLLMLLLFRVVLKKPQLALLAYAVTFGALVALTSGGNLQVSWWLQGIPAALVALTAMRYGLLAYVVARFVFYFLDTVPLTADPELWYFEATFFALGLVASIALVGLGMAHRSGRRVQHLARRA